MLVVFFFPNLRKKMVGRSKKHEIKLMWPNMLMCVVSWHVNVHDIVVCTQLHVGYSLNSHIT